MNKLFTIGTSFILGVGAGWLIQGRHWDIFLTSYIPALATLLAAFFGAKYDFLFQNDKELKTEKSNNIIAANKAMFTLSRMANSLYIYQRDVINPQRNNEAAFLELRPTLDMEKELIKLDIEGLYFLLQTEDRNLLGELIIEEKRYRTTIDVINARSKTHLQEVQPVLEKAGFISNSTKIVTHENIEDILGNRLYCVIKQSTEDVIFHVDSTVKSLKQVADKFKDGVKNVYPDIKIISFVLPGQNK